MKKLLFLMLLYSPICFAQKAIRFTISRVYSRDQNEIGTWNDWQQSKSSYIGINIDFNDNEILWAQPDSTGSLKWITQLLINSKSDDKYKSMGFKYIKLTGAALKDNKDVTYEIAYLDQEIIMITSDGNTQTKYLLKSQ